MQPDQLAQDLGPLRTKFIPAQELGISYAAPSWAAEWLRVILSAMEILYVTGGHIDVLRRTSQNLLQALSRNLTELRSSDAARVDAMMRLWTLRATVEGQATTKEAFFEFAHAIGQATRPKPKPKPKANKRKPSNGQSYERDQERQRTDPQTERPLRRLPRPP